MSFRTAVFIFYGLYKPIRHFLGFKVNGQLFKGRVYIGVNGKDLFDVFLTNYAMDILYFIKDVFAEDLIDAIDENWKKIQPENGKQLKEVSAPFFLFTPFIYL